MAEPKLTYGKNQEGRLVHIEDVPSGLECNCVCPECGVKLIARKGKKNQKHFSHINGADCAGARMTALHMLAQQIIQEEKKIRKPWFKDYCKDPSKEIYFESVLLEQRFKTTEINRRPDCVGIIKNGDKQYEVWIEVKVKHAIDEDKRNDIIRHGAICMEIDLSSLLTERYTEDSVRKALFDVYDNKEWINYPELFKKNDEAWRKSEEFKEYQQLKEQEEREELEVLVDGWMNCELLENAEEIINKIELDPYNQITDSKYKIIEFLVPEYDILKWLEISPRHTYTKKLFYIILKYYTPQLCNNLDRKLVDEKLNSFRFKQFIAEREKQELELLLSLKIVS